MKRLLILPLLLSSCSSLSDQERAALVNAGIALTTRIVVSQLDESPSK